MKGSIESNGKCAVCEGIVLDDRQLERDIRRLQGMIVAAYDFYDEICERLGDSAELMWINQHLSRAFLDPEELQLVLPEAEK